MSLLVWGACSGLPEEEQVVDTGMDVDRCHVPLEPSPCPRTWKGLIAREKEWGRCVQSSGAGSWRRMTWPSDPTSYAEHYLDGVLVGTASGSDEAGACGVIEGELMSDPVELGRC